MKRRPYGILATAWVISLALALAPATAKAQEALPKRIVLGANAPGSLFYVLAAGFAKVVSTHTPMKVEVFPQGGTVWYPMLATDEVQFGIQVPDDILTAYKGDAVYEKPTGGKGFPLRTLMLGSPLRVGLVVPGDSDIKTIKDVRGKRIPVDYGAFYSSTLSVLGLLANGGLSQDDVKALTVTTYVAGVRTVIEGRADVALGSVGSGIIEELKAAKGARFLSLETSPDAVAKMQEVHPGYYAAPTKPGPAGITEEIFLMGKDITLVAAEGLSDDVAYHIAKALWEHHEELAPVHPQLKFWTPDRFASPRAVVPYHPGAIKFYKEKGVWSGELEEHQKKLLTIK